MANIKLNNNEYSIPDSMLTAPRADFVAHLATIEGEGIRVVVDGVEYNVDPSKVADAVAEIEALLESLNTGADIPVLAAGLYDENNNLVASWEALTTTYGMDVTQDYYDNQGTLYKTSPTSPYYVLTNTPALANGVNLVIGDVAEIGNSAFRSCTMLTSVTIPDTVTSIGGDRGFVFKDCSNLKNVIMGNGVSQVLNDSFQNCPIETVYYKGTLEQWINILFRGNRSNPCYKGAQLYIGGVKLTNISIPDGVTSIGGRVFYNFSGLSGDLVIPDSVTSIGDGAFHNCSGLTSVDLGNGIQSIGSSSFSDCSGFSGELVIPDSVTSIGTDAFEGCSGLTSVDLGNGVQSIGRSAFSSCSGFSGELVIPDSVTSIGTDAFYSCSGLTSVDLGNGVQSIGRSAFSSCSGLENIIIPASVTSIDSSAFLYCWNIKNVYYTGTEEQWKSISIGSSNTPLTNATIHYNYQG